MCSQSVAEMDIGVIYGSRRTDKYTIFWQFGGSALLLVKLSTAQCGVDRFYLVGSDSNLGVSVRALLGIEMPS